VYGREVSWIPLANIAHADWHDDPRSVTTTLNVRTRGGERRWLFLRDNPTVPAYAAFLSRLAARG
jgi:hypothetical protein